MPDSDCTEQESLKHVLVVYCHPKRDSIGGRLVDSYTKGLVEAGISFEVADLYAEGFDPVFKDSDYAQFEGGELPEAIRAEQRRIDKADAVVIVSPLWWLSFPAMLKGWFDRVWSNGWAYEFENDPEGSLLRPRPFLLILTTGGSARSFAKRGYGKALECLIRVGILGWCGVSESSLILLHDSGFDDKTTRDHVHFVRKLATGPFIDRTLTVDESQVTLLDA